MSENFAARLAELPDFLSSHLVLSVSALLIAIGISLPLGIWLVGRPRWRDPMLALAGAAQTIPSLALLALMVPLLAATDGLGLGLPALGFPPALAALTLYGILPILRNTVTGLASVDPAVTRAARGVGMSDRQRLRLVELPLALPIIVTGIRTAAVWVVGTATLATPVGQSCLGNYIFTGLQTSNGLMVLFGVVGAAGLALGLDAAIGAIERAVARRDARAAARRTLAIAVGIALGASLPALVGGGSSSDPPPAIDDTSAHSTPPATLGTVRIGGKPFTEQYILTRLIERRLEAAGLSAERVESLGSTILLDALRAGEIDCVVDYSGTLWANALGEEGAAAAWLVEARVGGWLAENGGVRLLGSLGFENAYALAMRREQARTLGITSIADLSRHAATLRIGGDYEFFGRPEWASLVAAYRLDFRENRTFDPTLMMAAIANEQVDVISAYSSDGRIATHDLVVLEDPARALPPYDAIVLLSARIADEPAVIEALAPLLGAIDLRTMQEANGWVDRDDDALTVGAAARRLDEHLRGE